MRRAVRRGMALAVAAVRAVPALALGLLCGPVCGLVSPAVAQDRPPVNVDGLTELAPWPLAKVDLVADFLDPDVMRASGHLVMTPVGGTRRALVAIEKPARFVALTGDDAAVGTAVVDGADVGAEDFWLGVIEVFAEPDVPERVRVAFEVAHPGGAFLAFREGGVAMLHNTAAWYPTPGGGMRGAPGTTEVRVPAGWRALSGGQLVGSETDGRVRVETYRVDEASGRSVVAGPFQVEATRVGDRTISSWLLPGTRVTHAALAAGVDSILAVTTPLFGRYPYDHVGVVEVPDRVRGWLGVSGEGFVAVQQWLLPGELGFNLAMLAHEFGHGYWRNGFWRGENGLMISEALSQYTAVAAIESMLGRKAAVEFLEFSAVNYPDQSARGYFGIARFGQDRALGSLGGGPRDHDLADSKGIWVYDMIRRRIGDDAFFGALRRLRDEGAFARGEVGLGELFGAWQDAGAVDLEPMLVEWVDRPGAPVITFDVVERQSDRGRLCLRPVGPAYTLDLEVRVAGGDSRRLALSNEEVCAWFDGLREAVQVELDPDREYLLWRPSYGPPPIGG